MHSAQPVVPTREDAGTNSRASLWSRLRTPRTSSRQNYRGAKSRHGCTAMRQGLRPEQVRKHRPATRPLKTIGELIECGQLTNAGREGFLGVALLSSRSRPSAWRTRDEIVDIHR